MFFRLRISIISVFNDASTKVYILDDKECVNWLFSKVYILWLSFLLSAPIHCIFRSKSLWFVGLWTELISLYPFHIGGMIKLQRSSSVANYGPKFQFRAMLVDSYINANISGYIFLLGMSGEVQVVISPTRIMFNLTGTPWPGLLTANLFAETVFQPRGEMGFTVSNVIVRLLGFCLMEMCSVS